MTSAPAIGRASRPDDDVHPPPPLRPDQEWANAWSHGIAASIAVVLGGDLIRRGAAIDPGTAAAAAGYAVGVVGTFTCSTLSHAIHRQPWLNRFRSWDQAMIYLMITGTYTPIIVAHAQQPTRWMLVTAIWVAAIAGFVSKVALRHRINSISTLSYLLLGWLPAIPLVGSVPGGLGMRMLLGGVIYSLGVVFLVNDHRIRYLHVLWHAAVMAAAYVHYRGIVIYCL